MFSAHLYLYNTGHVSRVDCFTVKHANIIVNSQIQIVTPQFGKLLEWGCYNCGHGLSLETGKIALEVLPNTPNSLLGKLFHKTSLHITARGITERNKN